jgi:hypothetical protein
VDLPAARVADLMGGCVQTGQTIQTLLALSSSGRKARQLELDIQQ